MLPHIFVFVLFAALSSFVALDAAAAEKKAFFAGGCFWCMEEAFESVPGVTEVISGYSGGKTRDPTYKKVTGGNTGHFETVEVQYDDNKVSYEQLLRVFWVNIDPTDNGGQFCDRGSSYRSAIFYRNEEEKEIAQMSLDKAMKKLGEKILTPLIRFSKFYAAEEYHQDYYQLNPIRYKYYKYSCGRPARLEMLWG